MLVGRNELASDPVTIPFGVVSDSISTLAADFLTFGQNGSGDSVHKLVIYVIMSDGSKNYYTFDVTRQVDDAADPRMFISYWTVFPCPNLLSMAVVSNRSLTNGRTLRWRFHVICE